MVHADQHSRQQSSAREGRRHAPSGFEPRRIRGALERIHRRRVRGARLAPRDPRSGRYR